MWSLVARLDLVENPRSKRWYARFVITDGVETRTEELKFLAEPKEAAVDQAIATYLSERNAADSLVAKRADPPSITSAFTSQELAVLDQAAALLRRGEASVDPDVRPMYDQFVTQLEAEIARWVKPADSPAPPPDSGRTR